MKDFAEGALLGFRAVAIFLGAALIFYSIAEPIVSAVIAVCRQ